MERKANYALIGLFTFAVVAGAFGFIFWLHHTSGKKQAVAYRVIFDSSVSGLQVGGNVLFNGIRVGEVTDSPARSRQAFAGHRRLLAVNKATPIRSDTRVGLEFTGLTGVASVSLKGISATTPLIEREEGEPPTLKADPSASQDMMQAARDVLNKADEVIAANQEALHQAITDIATFSASLARNTDNVDSIMNNSKAAEQRQGGNGLGSHADRKSRQAHGRNYDRREQADGDRDAAGRARRQGDHGPRAQSAAHPVRRQRRRRRCGDDRAGTPAAVKPLRRRAHVVRIERQFHRLLALGRQIERLGQHQVAMRFFHRRRRGRQAERDAVEPASRSPPPSARAIRRAPCRRADSCP